MVISDKEREVNMADREKVIKGLECCSEYIEDASCSDCPYADDGECTSELAHDVLDLLKEQEEQIKTRDESLEKARKEIRWLREMLKEQESTLNRLRSTMEDMVRGNASEEVSYLLRLLDKWE